MTKAGFYCGIGIPESLGFPPPTNRDGATACRRQDRARGRMPPRANAAPGWIFYTFDGFICAVLSGPNTIMPWERMKTSLLLPAESRGSTTSQGSRVRAQGFVFSGPLFTAKSNTKS
jgi:hypothetical protein